jgi:hypothetical protein
LADEGTWLAIIIGMVLGLFYIVAYSRKSSKHPVSRSEGRRAVDEEN